MAAWRARIPGRRPDWNGKRPLLRRCIISRRRRPLPTSRTTTQRRWRLPAKTPALPSHFADLGQQQEAAVLGMWLFLATELMVFGALFTGYTVYRLAYPAEFA